MLDIPRDPNLYISRREAFDKKKKKKPQLSQEPHLPSLPPFRRYGKALGTIKDFTLLPRCSRSDRLSRCVDKQSLNRYGAGVRACRLRGSFPERSDQ